MRNSTRRAMSVGRTWAIKLITFFILDTYLAEIIEVPITPSWSQRVTDSLGDVFED